MNIISMIPAEDKKRPGVHKVHVGSRQAFRLFIESIPYFPVIKKDHFCSRQQRQLLSCLFNIITSEKIITTWMK